MAASRSGTRRAQTERHCRMNKKNVGIVSCYFKNNYGSVLQAYATQRILDEHHIENCTIDMAGIGREIRTGRMKYYLRNLLNAGMYRAKRGLIRHGLRRKTNRSFRGNIGLRVAEFDRFRREHIRLSARCFGKAALTRYCEGFSDVVLGSDQLWLPVNIEGDYYTLTFVPDGVNKIAYSTSFGVSSLPRYLHGRTRDFLRRIDHLSVREESAVGLARNIAGREAQLVCDPVFLIAPECWAQVAQNVALPAPAPGQSYIFCYFLGDNPKHRSYANRLKALTGMPIVALRHLDAYIPSDDDFGDCAPWAVGPAQFLSLLSGAAYICTDSFHCTSFAILFKKSFFAFERFGKESSQSTNGRIHSLLARTGLMSRLFQGDEDPRLSLDTDHSMTDGCVARMREASLQFLLNALRIEEAEGATDG